MAKSQSQSKSTSTQSIATPTTIRAIPRATPLKASGGYTEAQLAMAFNHVKPSNWKTSINTVIDHPGKKNMNCLAHAIVYFTGSFPHIKRTEVRGKISIKAHGFGKVQASLQS